MSHCYSFLSRWYDLWCWDDDRSRQTQTKLMQQINEALSQLVKKQRKRWSPHWVRQGCQEQSFGVTCRVFWSSLIGTRNMQLRKLHSGSHSMKMQKSILRIANWQPNSGVNQRLLFSTRPWLWLVHSLPSKQDDVLGIVGFVLLAMQRPTYG